MSDSPLTSQVHASEPPDDADREARIEQLLLMGLDHYFAGHYERAISVWTRVVFLERHHDRARAYIERARGALAERQRKSEEFLHDGVSAYNAGEIEKARDLLTRAVEQGNESADVFLARLNRVGTRVSGPDRRTDLPPARLATSRHRPAAAPARGGWTTPALFAVLVAAAMLVGGLPIGTWLSELEVAAPAPAAQPVFAEPLPVVHGSETVLDRARALYSDGRLRDALNALDDIGMADPFREEADRLRADLQRDLFSAAGLTSVVPAATGSRP